MLKDLLDGFWREAASVECVVRGSRIVFRLPTCREADGMRRPGYTAALRVVATQSGPVIVAEGTVPIGRGFGEQEAIDADLCEAAAAAAGALCARLGIQR